MNVLGARPAGWRAVQMRDVASFIMGQAPPGSECNFDGSGAVFVKAGEFGAERPIVREWTTRPLKFASSGDVLICVVGATAGKLNLGIDCAIGRSVAAIRPSEALDQKFLYYSLVPMIHTLRGNSAGSAQGVISREGLGDIGLLLPPLHEQRRIVDALDLMRGRSGHARTALESVPQLIAKFRQAVLAAAFRGDLTADWRERNPDTEQASVLLDRIRKERRQKWEEGELAKTRAKDKARPNDHRKAKYVEPVPLDATELPALPEGWCWASLKQLSWDAGYGTSVKCGYGGEGPVVLRIPNVAAGEIDLSDIKRALTRADSGFEELASGDLLVIRTNGSRGLIGRAAIIQTAPTTFTSFASYLIRYRLIGDSVFHRWVARLFDSPAVRDWIENQAATSAGQYNVSLSKLDNLPLPVPPDEELVVAVQRLDIARTGASNVGQASISAAALVEDLERSIVAKAFRGELVPQNPNDESATVLLERIRGHRAASEGEPKRSRRAQRSASREHRDTEETAPMALRDERVLRPTIRKSEPALRSSAERDLAFSIDDTELEEILFTIRHRAASGDSLDRDTFIREVARDLGFRRTGPRIYDAVERALNAACRRYIVAIENGVVVPYTGSIDDYTRDDVKQFLLSVLGTSWNDQQHATRALARHLGFKRTGRSIEAAVRSAVNGLIRQQQLERSGEQIRRT